MPRSLHRTEPEIINFVTNIQVKSGSKYLEIATGNKDKLREFQEILKDYTVVGKSIDVDEIQSLDPIKVVSKKAEAAFIKNGYNPILVEDTSLEFKGLGNRPGTYAKDFLDDYEMRKQIVTTWLKGKDRSALARVAIAIFDGKEARTWVGEVEGTVAEKPVGLNGFGWDDIFIPKGQSKTFAQMNSKEKNYFSMRTLAIKKFLKDSYSVFYPVFMLPEPFSQELERVQIDKLLNEKALDFAYKLECLENENKIDKNLTASNYSEIYSTSNSYFTRFLVNKNTKSLGLMLTDVDRKKLKLYENGNPYLWQMGPERRHLSLAQRSEFFSIHQNKDVHKILDRIDKINFPERTNIESKTIEKALGKDEKGNVTKAVSLKEIGYKKMSSDKNVSRTVSADFGLFNKIGKYARSFYGVGCLPFISGWRDVIVMSAVGHMLVFVHRNNINAIDINNQFKLIKEVHSVIKSLDLGKKETVRALRNIGAAIGCNPKRDLENAKKLYKIGVRAFRIYTINSDPRVIETALALRQEFGNKIEIFVGQVVDKKQSLRLIEEDIKVDGLILGHGGGRQCTSATNGMALSTLEEIYELVTDKRFNKTSIIVEGGIGTHVGALLLMGVDCILRNAQFASCVIEQGDLYFEDKNGEFCQPYHGSASAATMIIESLNPENRDQRLFYSGRTKKVEGKSGYIYYKERANSMSFYVEEFKHFAARALADLGVESIEELREFLKKDKREFFRLVTAEAQYTSSAYRNG